MINVRNWSREISETLQLGSLRREKAIKILAVIVLVFVCIFLVVNYVPYGVDWRTVFRPATQAILHLESPFSIDGYFNAPWAMLLLTPIAFLPESLGYALLVLGNLLAFSYTAHRLGAKPPALVALLLSPPVLHCLLNGNIDGLVVLGFVLPPQFGLFFLLIKPQIGIALAIYWLFETGRRGGIREIWRIFGPVTVVLIGSFLIYGLWPLRFEKEIDLWWNASLWPFSIPIGLALIMGALLLKRKALAMAASPFLSPYVLLHAWVGVLLAMVSSIPATIVSVIGLWIFVLV